MAERAKWEKRAALSEWKDPHNFDKYKLMDPSAVESGVGIESTVKGTEVEEAVHEQYAPDAYADYNSRLMAKIFNHPTLKESAPYDEEEASA